MPATLLFEDHHRAQIAHRLRRSLNDTRTHARRAAEARRNGRQLEEQKTQLVSANPRLASMDVHRKTVCLWILIGIVAAYLIDVVLFAAVPEYFVKQNFGGSPLLARLAQFLLPAAIIAIEMVLSMQRDAAHQEYLEGFGSRLKFWAFSVGTAFFALVMPMGVMGIFLAGEGEDFAPWVSIPLLITLVGMSLICHMLMLFGGRLALESKSWLTFKIQTTGLQSRTRQVNRTYATNSQAAADRFAAYLQDLNTHNAPGSPTRIEPGPFDRDTREVVNEVYGYEVIRTPATIQAGEAPGTPQTPPSQNPPQNPPDGSTPDWRTVYDRQMHEQEAEVRP